MRIPPPAAPKPLTAPTPNAGAVPPPVLPGAHLLRDGFDDNVQWAHELRDSLKPPPNPVSVILPESGPGYITYNREVNGRDQTGTKETVDAIQKLGAAWEKNNPDRPLEIGDISRYGGGPFWKESKLGDLKKKDRKKNRDHAGHRNGKQFDMRPVSTGGGRTNIKADNYDRDKTRELIQLIKQQNPNAKILFNDPVLIAEGLCVKSDKTHDNHLHVIL